MGNNNSSRISANNYYFPGYSWPSSFLTSATKLANVKSNISSDIDIFLNYWLATVIFFQNRFLSLLLPRSLANFYFQ